MNLKGNSDLLDLDTKHFETIDIDILQSIENVHFKIQISIMRIVLEKTPAHDTIVHGKSLYCSA